ncbi:OmpA family protein [Niabella ginsengisoli]|uniref:OmpA family protein n=1 Tax=Niabella ginsengisoli TaxID=522298 RepID=A0ABS9SPH4_9BACT|nr:OmpA family protein [Niabella ginsengisoli]MCH5600277.1 OmpA family protein [Niabella ginsengisoli]
MSINIVDLVKNYVSQDLISKASSFLGESEGGISKAIAGLVPSILGGVVAKGTESEADSQQLLDTARDANNTGLLGNLDSLFGNADLLSKGTGWFNKVFGGQSSTIIDSISNFAEIKNSSSGTLISIITPLIMALLGKQAEDNNLNASGFSKLLSDQKSSIVNAMPSDLGGLSAMLGLGAIGSSSREAMTDVSDTTSATYNYSTEQTEKTGSGLKSLLPLLLLAALAFLLWWLMGKGCNKGDGMTGSDTVATAPVDSMANTTSALVSGTLDTVSGNYIYDVGANKEIKLADGTTLTVGEKSTEVKLYNMLNDASFVVDTANKSANWIVLDRVYFETGVSDLTSESATQVKNIAAILKNFPTASIKLGGYTDNTGDAAINKEISRERAKIVAKKLVGAGVSEKRVVEAQGYGSDFPVCPANDTPECKAQNRRVDLKVATK